MHLEFYSTVLVLCPQLKFILSSLHVELKLLNSKIFISCFLIQTKPYLDTSSGGSWYALTKPGQSSVVTARHLLSSTPLTIPKGIIGVPAIYIGLLRVPDSQ